MLNCLTYIAFVYWAVITVHTVLPVDVAVCGAAAVRGGLGALFKHAFGGDLDVDVDSWRGFPCNSNLLVKMAFILARPRATIRHILYGGGQDEPFVPILFIVPLMFFTATALRRMGIRVMSETAARTMLKFGVAVGCRSVIVLHSLVYPEKESVYYKRYSKVEFCIIAWTAYIIELPVWHEALVSGATAVCTLLMCGLFPHHMLPEVNPINVATQAVAAAAVGVGHAYYLQRRRVAEQAALAARSAAKAAAIAAAAELDEQQVEQVKQKTKRRTTEELDAGASTSGAAVTMAAGSSIGGRTVIAEHVSAATAAAVPPPPAAPAAAPQETCGAPPLPLAPPAAAASASAASAASSLAALRRIHELAGRSYVSAARPCRFSIKIQHAHLSDLPPDLMSVINSEVLNGSGWQAVSAHAREGCVELVLDLRPLLPARPVYGREVRAAADDRRAAPDQDHDDGGGCDDDRDDVVGGGAAAVAGTAVAMDPASLRDLARSIVSYLHRTGVLQHEREQMVMLQMGPETISMAWSAEADEWVFAESLATGPGAAVPMPPAPPTLQYVTPRVALWEGAESRLRLSALLTGPSAEEILAGGGLVVRSASRPLPYSVLLVRPAAAPEGTPAEVAEPTPELLVDIVVQGAPSSGLLVVEARSSSGLLSSPLAVIVDEDAVLVLGLKALLSAMDEGSAEALLLDYGTWLDLAAAHASGAVAPVPAATLSGYDMYGNCCNVADGGKGRGGAAAAQLPRSAEVMVSAAGTAADAQDVNVPYRNLFSGARDQIRCGVTGGGDDDKDDVRGGADCGASRTSPTTAMLTVAADLLNVCCQGAGAGAAVAAVVDRLIACVLACDSRRTPAVVLAALLDAVPAPPTNAGALHLAVASGSRPLVEVLVRWHERVYDSSGAAASATRTANPWLARAACGVTPLHVAAAMPDGGAMVCWILDTYDSAAAVWGSAVAASDDGLTPAALAAQLGGRWRLRLWRASAAVWAVRRAMRPPPALSRAWELLWGFQDLPLERRFSEDVSGQSVAALAIYTAVNTLPPLLTLVKAALYGSSDIALATLAFHVPHIAPLVAWFCQSCPGSSASAKAGPAALAATAAAQESHGSVPEAGGPTAAPAPRVRPPVAATARFGLLPGSPRKPASISRGMRLQNALMAMHLCRAAAKAAVGLSLWPFALPHGTEVFVSRGGDIALEAVVRPLLEQAGLPARLLVSLADGPAMLLLYRGMDRKYPGLLPRPLERVLLYQVVLLATTAAVSAANRARFLRAQGSRTAWVDRTAAGGPSSVAHGGGLAKGPDPGSGGAAAHAAASLPRAFHGECQRGAVGAGSGSVASGWTWLRGPW